MKIKPVISTILIFLSATLLWSCQEEYHVDLQNTEPFLVVDGLLTDQQGPHEVRLSKSVKFQDQFIPQAVSGASLRITVSDGQSVPLTETQPGVYQTPANFEGIIGRSYVLHITAQNGEEYVSAPQTLMPPLSIDSVFGQLGEEIFYLHSQVSNNVYPTAVDGTNTFLKTSGTNEDASSYRFVSELYLQYLIIYGGIGGAVETVDNCWIRRQINDQLGTDLGNRNLMQNATDKIGFVLRERNQLPYYGFTEQLYQSHRVLINKIFTLNEDSYEFHKAKNEQLSDEGRFFDPIAAQIQGNMQCITDPQKVVLGLFEASSELIITYKIESDFQNNTVDITMIDNLHTIPRSGCLYEEYPDHWLF
ncbi:MAG: DUF4249 domain-containing protein [Bacteroidales bacterium]|nr:DUF4249 domain-containing protein [Bacteroidales bacterium]